MADDNTKDALGQALVYGGGTSVLAMIAVAVKGWLTGLTGQEAAIRKALQEENERLRPLAKNAMRWEALARKARFEAEKLGFEPTKWPADPAEEDDP